MQFLRLFLLSILLKNLSCARCPISFSEIPPAVTNIAESTVAPTTKIPCQCPQLERNQDLEKSLLNATETKKYSAYGTRVRIDSVTDDMCTLRMLVSFGKEPNANLTPKFGIVYYALEDGNLITKTYNSTDIFVASGKGKPIMLTDMECDPSVQKFRDPNGNIITSGGGVLYSS
uniref:Major sperm protein n=1 Tax=Caenorhabditis japonica TaxID=281687 RepID=A0A8R1HIV2_CAEJA